MRGKKAQLRPVKPDPIYGSELVTKFINYLMLDGKKEVARGIIYRAIDEVAKQTKMEGVDALAKAFENVKPKIEVRSRRVGGSNYQVPVPVPEHRQVALACKWIIEAARSGRGNKPIEFALAREIVAAYNKEGNAMRKKEDVKKMAEANKAFAQFA